MLYDANLADFTHAGEYDACVIGGGPAGIVLALRLADQGRRVCLLEAGGLEPDPTSQEMYETETHTAGTSLRPADASRLRYLGGTTGHWRGQCFRRDPFDFERREDVPYSGWPIGFEQLEPYTTAAEDFLHVRPFGTLRQPFGLSGDVEVLNQSWSSARGGDAGDDPTPVRFGAEYRAALERATAIDVVLNANVLGLQLDPARRRVTGVRYESYSEIARVVTAGVTVLAMGAIENSRFLLHQNALTGNRLGNQGDMVGRCFMDHPILANGTYFVTRRLYSHLKFWGLERLFWQQKPELVLGSPVASQRQAGVLGARVHLDRLLREPLAGELTGKPDMIAGLKFDRDYFFTGQSRVLGEQAPNPESRITLSPQKDRFGIPRAVIDRRLLPMDFHSMRHATQSVAREFIRTGLGRMQINPALWDDYPQLDYEINNEHMGGIRMADGPETGVVDADCKVFGTENLFVAGAAVFATSGHATPTFTIVQLALRLADRLGQAQVKMP